MKCARFVPLLAPLAAFPQANPWYQTDFPPEEFKARWNKVFERVGERAVAVLEGVPQTNGFIMPAPGQTISRQAPVPVIIQE